MVGNCVAPQRFSKLVSPLVSPLVCLLAPCLCSVTRTYHAEAARKSGNGPREQAQARRGRHAWEASREKVRWSSGGFCNLRLNGRPADVHNYYFRGGCWLNSSLILPWASRGAVSVLPEDDSGFRKDAISRAEERSLGTSIPSITSSATHPKRWVPAIGCIPNAPGYSWPTTSCRMSMRLVAIFAMACHTSDSPNQYRHGSKPMVLCWGRCTTHFSLF